MELPKYLQTLAAYKWLLLLGVVFAVLAGLASTFTVTDGQIDTRASKSYRAATTIMLSNPTRPIYQAQFRVTQAQPGLTTESRDLDSVATIYAYIISGTTVAGEVQSVIGPLQPGEAIRASQRTTQPGADTSTQGRLSLPLIDVIGISTDPTRAVQISQAANEAFQRDATAEQDSLKLKAADRVNFMTLAEGGAVEQDGSNPAIPGLAAGLGVLVLFALAIFVIDNIRTSARRRSTRRSQRARAREQNQRSPTARLTDAEPAVEGNRELSEVGSGAGL